MNTEEQEVKNEIINLETINANALPELQGWREKQETLLSENPFLDITDNKTYADAKKRRTALLKGRTTIQSQDKLIASKLKDFRTKVLEASKELIAITIDAEDKQQEEVKRYEEVKEVEKAEKAKLEAERKAAIEKNIYDLAIVWEKTIKNLTLATANNLNIIEALSEVDTEQFEEFDALWNDKTRALVGLYHETKTTLQSKEDQRLENIRLEVEAEKLAKEKADFEKEKAENKRIEAAKQKAEADKLAKEKADFEAEKAENKRIEDEIKAKKAADQEKSNQKTIDNHTIILINDGYKLVGNQFEKDGYSIKADRLLEFSESDLINRLKETNNFIEVKKKNEEEADRLKAEQAKTDAENATKQAALDKQQADIDVKNKIAEDLEKKRLLKEQKEADKKEDVKQQKLAEKKEKARLQRIEELKPDKVKLTNFINSIELPIGEIVLGSSTSSDFLEHIESKLHDFKEDLLIGLNFIK